jgi:CspA family cold shock protein
MHGSVKFYNQGRGYGFIIPDNGGKDVFVHVTSIKASKVVGPINEGDKLSFDIEEGKRGQSAVNISRMK